MRSPLFNHGTRAATCTEFTYGDGSQLLQRRRCSKRRRLERMKGRDDDDMPQSIYEQTLCQESGYKVALLSLGKRAVASQAAKPPDSLPGTARPRSSRW